MTLYLDDKPIRLDARRAIGKGGEADVYSVRGKALKVWKTPEHPDLEGLPTEQAAARRRIGEYQSKLPAFPTSLPARVTVPRMLATDDDGRIAGYTMELLRDAEPLARFADRAVRSRSPGWPVRNVLLDLHATVSGLHARGVVIGDFNDLNVLVVGEAAHLIDADSFQFDRFACRVFTSRFVDPLLCEADGNRPVLSRPYTEDSDWYAFAALAMQTLLYVGPYGGVHRPAMGRPATAEARPLKRITVFDPAVRYPKPAIPYQALPNDLLHYFEETFARNRRGPFPRSLLEDLAWVACPSCGIEHGRDACPVCHAAVAGRVRSNTRPNRTQHVGQFVVASEVFETSGAILAAAFHGGQLRYVYRLDDRLWREEGAAMNIDIDDATGVRFALRGRDTFVAKGDTLWHAAPTPGGRLVPRRVDRSGTEPAFAVNSRHVFRVDQGRLLRDGGGGASNGGLLDRGPTYWGDVLAHQTRLWVGETFGFGFYRAGNLRGAFVFDADRPGINDRLDVPPVRGELIDADCAFADDRVWFITSESLAGQLVHRATVIGRHGQVEATLEQSPGESAWLATVGGKAAWGDSLFAATDEGIVRVAVDGGQIVLAKEFPETELFVDRGSGIVLGTDGLYVTSPRRIRHLALGSRRGRASARAAAAVLT